MSIAPQKSPAPTAGTDSPPPQTVAKINFHITKFLPLSEGLVEAEMKLTNPGKIASQPDPDTILVNIGGATLEISTTPSTQFRPMDIEFERNGKPVPIGAGGPFKNKVVTPALVRVDDTVHGPPPGTPAQAKRFKFTVTVQRLSDNALGKIDPDLENEN